MTDDTWHGVPHPVPPRPGAAAIGKLLRELAEMAVPGEPEEEGGEVDPPPGDSDEPLARFIETARELLEAGALATAVPGEPGEAERRRCVYCQHGGDDLEVIYPHTGNRACRNWRLCNVRQQGLNPATELADLARAFHPAGALNELSTLDLARLATVIRPLRDYINTHLSARADSARSLRQARAEYGCPTCGAIGYEDCTNALGAKVRRHKRRTRAVTRSGAALDI